jgi:hypothetical protein
MEAAHSCKIMVPIYQITQGHIPESSNLQLTLLPRFLMFVLYKYSLSVDYGTIQKLLLQKFGTYNEHLNKY